MPRRTILLLPWVLVALVVPAIWLQGWFHILVTILPGLLVLPLLASFLFLPPRWIGLAAIFTAVGQVALTFVHVATFHPPLAAETGAATLVLSAAMYGGSALLLWAYRRRIRRVMTKLSGRHDEAMSELAGGVAHDLSNLLTIALGTARIMERSGELSEQLRADLDTVADTVRSSTDLVRQLTGSFADRDLPGGLIEVNALLVKTGRHIQPSLPPGVELEILRSTCPLHVRGTYMQLQRAIFNLLFNARDAIDGKGRIELGANRRMLDSAEAHFRGVDGGDYAVISVVDNGHGMSSRTQANAFRPLYTTKEPGRGNGMGLAIVDEILHRLGGFMDVNSRPSRGSRFDIYLPLAATPDPSVNAIDQDADHHAAVVAGQ